jgi:hypothetical protein
MYRLFFSILFVLALTVALSAQMQTQTASGSTEKSQGQSATLTGCLSGPNDEGAYVLKSGGRSVEVGGSDELKAHVGHEVKLDGSWASSGSAIGEREENEAAEHNKKAATGEAAEHKEKGERHFKVSSISMVSDTCTAGKK